MLQIKKGDTVCTSLLVPHYYIFSPRTHKASILGMNWISNEKKKLMK